jgi:hypothetical protein
MPEINRQLQHLRDWQSLPGADLSINDKDLKSGEKFKALLSEKGFTLNKDFAPSVHNSIVAMLAKNSSAGFDENRFRALLSACRKSFPEKEISYPALVRLVKLSKTISDNSRRELFNLVSDLQKQGQKVSLDDVPFLAGIAASPSLKKLVLDRGALEGRLAGLYQKKEFRRYQDFPERPPAKEISSVRLLETYMMSEYLGKNGNLEILGRMVSRDVANETSESGGEVIRDGDGLMLRDSPAKIRKSNHFYLPYTSFEDYVSLLETDDLVGLFHFHATQLNDTRFCAPSGLKVEAGEMSADRPKEGMDGSPEGDFFCSWRERATGFLVTTIGHPADGSGQPVKDKMRVNVDVYWVENKDRKPVVVDLGEYILPFENLPHRRLRSEGFGRAVHQVEYDVPVDTEKP